MWAGASANKGIRVHELELPSRYSQTTLLALPFFCVLAFYDVGSGGVVITFWDVDVAVTTGLVDLIKTLVASLQN